jgi:nitrate reductase (NAD(P)H)
MNNPTAQTKKTTTTTMTTTTHTNLVLEMKGPSGGFVYKGHGEVCFGGTNRGMTATHIVMICAGSGLTPMLQLLRFMLSTTQTEETETETEHPSHRAKLVRVTLVYSNRTLADVIAREELERYANVTHEHRFTLHLILTRRETTDEPSQVARSRISLDSLRALLPVASEDVCVLVCGPPAFNATVSTALKALYYHSGQTFAF